MILLQNPNITCIFKFSFYWLCKVSEQIKIFCVQFNFLTIVWKLFQQKYSRCLTIDAVYMSLNAHLENKILAKFSEFTLFSLDISQQTIHVRMLIVNCIKVNELVIWIFESCSPVKCLMTRHRGLLHCLFFSKMREQLQNVSAWCLPKEDVQFVYST